MLTESDRVWGDGRDVGGGGGMQSDLQVKLPVWACVAVWIWIAALVETGAWHEKIV